MSIHCLRTIKQVTRLRTQLLQSRRRLISSITSEESTGLHTIDRSPKQAILFLSTASWPEPNATAAGTRTNSLLEHFTSSELFTSVHFGCGATRPSSFDKDTNKLDVHWHHINLNRGDEMKTLLNTIQDEHGPVKAVVFDRIYAEEAYSFMIQEICPTACRILDMQDVHSLRIGRQSIVQAYDRDLQSNVVNSVKLSSRLIEDVMSFDPKDNRQETHLANTSLDKAKAKSYATFLRELASIHRSDLVLVCSSDEMKLLQSWNVQNWKMELASFFCDNAFNVELPSFDDRCDFVTVGG